MAETQKVLSPKELHELDAWWRAANYLAAGQLYLLDNPLLKEPLNPDDIKKKSWATGAQSPARTSYTRT